MSPRSAQIVQRKKAASAGPLARNILAKILIGWMISLRSVGRVTGLTCFLLTECKLSLEEVFLV